MASRTTQRAVARLRRTLALFILGLGNMPRVVGPTRRGAAHIIIVLLVIIIVLLVLIFLTL